MPYGVFVVVGTEERKLAEPSSYIAPRGQIDPFRIDFERNHGSVPKVSHGDHFLELSLLFMADSTLNGPQPYVVRSRVWAFCFLFCFVR